MTFALKFIGKVILNALALYVAVELFPGGFILIGGLKALVAGAIVLALLNTFVRPLLRLVTAPIVWITFGLFNIVINIAVLWFADRLLNEVIIQDFWTLFWVSFIVAIANWF